MKYITKILAAIVLLSTSKFSTKLFADSQVDTDFSYTFQLSADIYLYELDTSSRTSNYVLASNYDGELFGLTLKVIPNDPDVNLSGEISIRSGELNGNETEADPLDDGFFGSSRVESDRDEVELRFYYHLTDNIFVTAAYIRMDFDSEGRDVFGQGIWESETEINMLPIGFGFTRTTQLGNWYVSPKAIFSYVHGNADSDYEEIYFGFYDESSGDSGLTGFHSEVTVIFDRPLNENNSFFTEIGWEYQDVESDDSGFSDFKLSGFYGRIGYSWVF